MERKRRGDGNADGGVRRELKEQRGRGGERVNGRREWLFKWLGGE